MELSFQNFQKFFCVVALSNKSEELKKLKMVSQIKVRVRAAKPTPSLNLQNEICLT